MFGVEGALRNLLAPPICGLLTAGMGAGHPTGSILITHTSRPKTFLGVLETHIPGCRGCDLAVLTLPTRQSHSLMSTPCAEAALSAGECGDPGRSKIPTEAEGDRTSVQV
ncbi:hypothetical protein AAFF_G00181550 [Aldrovandia affinis]|uniref:Uncharacterized protein n=1 Tax=Aldrovandia affinis TaxID=143900 RepID=A0AAD7WW25_9TELE|nr:hypothetical protein AAFF_G00181550 [Aldrovandia affinis]